MPGADDTTTTTNDSASPSTPPQEPTPTPWAAPDALPRVASQGSPPQPGPDAATAAASDAPGPYAATVPPHGPSSPEAGYASHPGSPAAPGGPGLAIAAFVLALVALSISWVPIVQFLAAVIAVIGLGLGVPALVLAVRKGRAGLGLSIAAVAVAGGALLLAAGTFFLYDRLTTAFADGFLGQESEDWPEPTVWPPGPREAGPPAAELVVVETSFGQATLDPTTSWYVVIMDNPNPEHVFPAAEILVEAVGADGTILDSDTVVTDVLPGRVAVTGRFISVGSSVVDHLEIRAPEAADAVHGVAPGAFAVSDLSATNDEWSTTVTGVLAGSFTTEQSYVRLNVVARDPQGVVIGAEADYVERLPAGGQVRFEVLFFDVLPEGTTFEAYATR